MRKFILAIDEGTTSTRCVLFDAEKKEILDIVGQKITQFYPHSAWVEQDAEEIFEKVQKCANKILKKNSVQKGEILGLAITNQRETVVAWDKRTGKPICNAIVWQDRRTAGMIKRLHLQTREKIKEKTGLIANSYFCASKMKWILENVKGAKKLASSKNLCFGTIDSFLCFKLTGNHLTDTTNASRTMLMNLRTLDWDDELLRLFKIPKETLPKICACDQNFGYAKKFHTNLISMIGDQQSSMIGQGAFSAGDTKVTYGTGGFVLSNLGEKSKTNLGNLLTTVASTLGGETQYAVEGSIYSACSGLNFLKDQLGLFDDFGKISEMAKNLGGNDGVFFVPAFTGLGAPYWKDDARAAIFGMTYSTTKAHIIRACLEGMAYNTKALVDEIKHSGIVFNDISVDGGGSNNEFLLQFLADMLNHKVVKSKFSEATVLGSIFVAMLSLGLMTKEEIKAFTKSKLVFTPSMSESERKKNFDGWKKAISKA